MKKTLMAVATVVVIGLSVLGACQASKIRQHELQKRSAPAAQPSKTPPHCIPGTNC